MPALRISNVGVECVHIRGVRVAAASDEMEQTVDRPLVIGVAGGSGSGKTTVSNAILERVGRERIALLQHDAYYRDLAHLPFAERTRMNFDHPDSLETELLVEHLDVLRRGEAVEVPSYDFSTHRRRAERHRVDPAPVIAVEGILVFADERLRQRFDLKVFVDTDADIRVFRRIRRDIEQRGRTFQSVRDQYYRTVRPMHLQFVEPSKRWADVIVPEGGKNSVAIELLVNKLKSVIADARP